MKNSSWLFVLMVVVVFADCKKKDPTVAITKMENDFKTAPTKENYAALIGAYKTFLKENPEDHTNSFRYGVAAAQISYKNRESAAALHLAGDAISKHGEGQNFSEAVALLALIQRDINYKELATLRFENVDFQRLTSLLNNNFNWLDSALVSMKRRLFIDSTQRVDREACMKFCAVAESAAAIRPDPKRSPEWLMAAAEAALAAENYSKAVALFEQIQGQYGQSPKASQALFLQAFTYENNLNELDKAKTAYQLFLKKYPDDEFADDAQMALKNLGKSPEELVKEFEKRLK